ncbi:sulfate/molybdate ABC transporter ATP-binding protein [Dyella sp. 20L07]|uniref:sulfate/molybdate ABC transporter ATP-binding protein n=1 Tax=Dyella sp. 20L07 TaxID=3384240 RepID=UPI003D2D6604
MTLELSHLNRRFAEFRALDDVSLTIAPGEFLALLGPSGSGKTTLLRILAGLDYPDTGAVLKGGDDFLATPARERRIGMVFQHYALFRHLTVTENIAFGLRVRPWRTRPSRAKIHERVDRLLTRVQLDGLGGRFPTQLSGGQRQRVALARALAVEPDLLLLDEPFGALDALVRVTLRRWLRELHEELKLTTVFVTHDQEEALELADRVAVMNNGRIEQVGSPEVIYQQPATPFVCEFIGKVNRFAVRRNATGLTAGGWALDSDPWHGQYAAAVAYVRPEQLRLAVPASEPAWEASLRHIYLAGSVAHLDLHVPSLDQALEADVASEDLSRLGLQAGMKLRVAPRRAVLFPQNGEGVTIDRERWIWHEQDRIHA